jgi:hypothetical protein
VTRGSIMAAGVVMAVQAVVRSVAEASDRPQRCFPWSPPESNRDPILIEAEGLNPILEQAKAITSQLLSI